MVALLLVTLVGGCGLLRLPRGGTPIGGQTQHFAGETTTLSADGGRELIPPTPTLLERVIDPRRARVIERVFQPNYRAETVIADTGRRDEKGVAEFAATVDDDSFGGAYRYSDSPLTGGGRWVFDLILANGAGRIEGHGEHDAAGRRTERRYVTVDDQVRVILREDLRPVSREEYRRRLIEMTRGPSTQPATSPAPR